MNIHGRVFSARAHRRCAGFSLCDLLVTMTALILLSAVTLPLLASTTDGMGIAGSKRNLMQLHMAHQMYGADYNGNQWVNGPHDLAEFGDTYDEAMSVLGNWFTWIGYATAPASGGLGLWRFTWNGYALLRWPTNGGHRESPAQWPAERNPWYGQSLL